MRSIGHTGVKQGKTDSSKKKAGKCHPGGGTNSLYIVGIGPGHPDHLSKRAREVLKEVDTVAGYTKYIELIQSLLKNKQIISTGMTKEIDRVNAAIERALAGGSCAIISSGDPGIYAMAGLVFEMCEKMNISIEAPAQKTAQTIHKKSLQVEVIPGIPALCASASQLGAPLTHDFATISLSDLLTPWDLIEKRLEAAAMSDFVIVLYNPKSKRRNKHLENAQKILLKHKDKGTVVGVVTRAMRENQQVHLTTLEYLHEAYADMESTIIIGSSATRRYMNFLVTPRGYSGKYSLSKDHNSRD